MKKMSLHDFSITGAGEFPCLRSTSCFRANRRSDGLPVLLHRYRPPDSLLDYEPKIYNDTPPDFTRPFVTRFIGIVQAAGSAYLVEPLPLCIPLEDAWRRILADSPRRAVGFARTLIKQINEALSSSTPHDWCLGTLCLYSIVLTPAGTYGLLAEQIECERVRLMLRSASLKKAAHPITPPFSVARLLRELLGIEDRIGHIMGEYLLTAKQKRALRKLADEVRLPTSRPHSTSSLRKPQVTAVPV